MSQNVKLQISSDIEDVTRVSSVLLDEALLHVNDLVELLKVAKEFLLNFNITNEQDVQKLSNSLEWLNSTRIPLSKIDNRLSDVVAIVGGLNKILTQPPEKQQEGTQSDNVATG